jgi:hypothetical protein
VKALRHLAVFALVLAAGAAGGAQTPAPAKPAVDVTGKWVMELQLEMGTATPTLELKQEGEKLSGTYTGRYGAFPLAGTIKDRALQFAFKMNADGTDVSMSFSGDVAADAQSMKGKAELEGLGEAAWTARRDKK